MKLIFQCLTVISILLFSVMSIHSQNVSTNINTTGMTVNSRVTVPDSFFRPPFPISTYQSYLQSLVIKSADSKVMKYDGYEKKFICYSAVLQIDLMEEDMMRGEHYIQYLRAKFLYNSSKYDMIDFSYDDGRSLTFEQWAEGARFVWQDSIYIIDTIAGVNYTENSFKKYMDQVYMNSTTNGLAMDTKLLEVGSLSIGDLMIQPKDMHTPGHAVLVIDMAVNPLTGEKMVLLAQGFSPTQDMHILSNPYEADISPWYRVQEDNMYFTTAQWTFRKKHIRRFLLNANAENFNDAVLAFGED